MSTGLPPRIVSHREGLVEGFLAKYRCVKLDYYEECSDFDLAYMREEQIKGRSRVKKVVLINLRNPAWNDLFEDLIQDCS